MTSNRVKTNFTIAIIMRAHDRPYFIERAIQSIVNQSFADWQLIIVNDGRKPNTLEQILKKYASQIENKIRIIQLNALVGRASGKQINIGIHHSNSEYLAILDDDDSWHPDFLSKTLSNIGSSNAIVTQALKISEYVSDSGIVEYRRDFFEAWQKHEISLFRLAQSPTFPSNAMVFRRDVLESIGYFDDALGPLENWEFSLRLFSAFEIKYLEEPLANYHIRDSMSRFPNEENKFPKIKKSNEVKIRNSYIRADLESGKYSIGTLLQFAADYNTLSEKVNETQQILEDRLLEESLGRLDLGPATRNAKEETAPSIAYALDRKFVVPLCVSMKTILKHYKGKFKINFHIIHIDLTEQDMAFIELATKSDKNYEIHWIKADTEKLKHLRSSESLPTVAYLRILLPEILPHLERVLYLDSDTVILDDITELFEYFNPSYSVMACLDAYENFGCELNGLSNLKQYQVHKLSPYYNSGVLLLNLRLWRENRWSEIILEFAEKNPDALKFSDQNPINIILHKHIISLPGHWNAQSIHPEVILGKWKLPFQPQNYDAAKIIHYTTEYKPWNKGANFPQAKFSKYFCFLNYS